MLLTLNDLKESAVSYTLRNESVPFNAELAGVSSGFPSVDSITNGWQKGNLILIASNSSICKTDFAASMLLKMAVDMKMSIAYFIHEISASQLVTCILTNCCELEREDLRNGQLTSYEWEQFDYRGKRLADLPVYFEESPSISMKEIFSKINYLTKSQPVEILFVDTIDQIVVPYSMSHLPIEVLRNWRLKQLRQLAMKLKIPVIVMLTTDHIHSDNAKVQRQRDSIVAYTDVACIIKNPLRKDPLSKKPRKVSVDICKNRNGNTGSTSLVYSPAYARFSEVDQLE
jgi:replicative DNA helicase